MDCLFCKLANGDIPSYKIYEDDLVIVFLDINPDCNGHSLVVPKNHFKDLYDIDEETLLHVYKVAKDISKTLEKKLGCDGVSFLQNNGTVQEVKHFHLHIKPYYSKKPSIKLVKDNSSIEDPKNIFEKLK